MLRNSLEKFILRLCFYTKDNTVKHGSEVYHISPTATIKYTTTNISNAQSNCSKMLLKNAVPLSRPLCFNSYIHLWFTSYTVTAWKYAIYIGNVSLPICLFVSTIQYSDRTESHLGWKSLRWSFNWATQIVLSDEQCTFHAFHRDVGLTMKGIEKVGCHRVAVPGYTVVLPIYDHP